MDIRIHLVLVEKMNFPPFEHAPIITEGIQDLSLGATKFLDIGIVFKCSKDSEKFSFQPPCFIGAQIKNLKILSRMVRSPISPQTK